MLPARTADPGEVQTITHRHHTLADRPGEASIRPVTGGLLAAVFAPVMQVWLGLPAGATAALLVGFLRKDLAVGMLVPLGMTPEQLVIAVTMLTIYFPCVAAFVVLLREMGMRGMLTAAGVMLTAALLVGGALRLVLIGF